MPADARSRQTGGRREARARERRRLAQALHDGPLQIAIAARVRLRARRQAIEDPSAEGGLDEAIALLGQVIAALRAMLRDPPRGAGAGSLEARLRRAARRWGGVTGVRVHLRVPGAGRSSAFPEETLEVAEHIVGEGIVNAWKHGRATQVSVRGERRRGGLLLTLRDNGRGFQPSTAPGDGTGTGLRLLRARVGELGGRVDVRSSPRGAVVQAWLPPRPGGHARPG